MFDWSRARKCGQNDNFGHCNPILVRNDPKTQEGSFSNSHRIDQKLRRKISRSWIEDMARSHSGNGYITSVWSGVNGHFMRKRHWDRVKLVLVLTRFTFWLRLVSVLIVIFVELISFRATFKSFWDLTEVSAPSEYKVLTYYLVDPTFKISLLKG